MGCNNYLVWNQKLKREHHLKGTLQKQSNKHQNSHTTLLKIDKKIASCMPKTAVLPNFKVHQLGQCFSTGYIIYPSVYQIKIKVYNWETIFEGYTASIWAPLTHLNTIAKKLILHNFYHTFQGKLNWKYWTVQNQCANFEIVRFCSANYLYKCYSCIIAHHKKWSFVISLWWISIWWKTLDL